MTTHVEPSAASSMPRRRWRRRFWFAVGLLVVVWLALAGVALLRGVVAADHGMHRVRGVENGALGTGVTSAATTASLRQAEGDFAAASSDLASPWLDPLQVVPVVGRQLQSVRSLASAAEQVARTGADVLGRARRALDTPDPGGEARVTLLQQLATLARRTDASLARIDTGPGSGLIGPVATRHRQLVDQLTRARTELRDAAASASAVATILQGPQRYLVLMGNNAEMRAGSGAFLEVGMLTTGQGSMSLSDVQDAGGLALAPGEVQVGGDLQARWGWLLPGVDWRNIGLTPQFDVNGPLAAAMWRSDTCQQVDGVVAVDVEALQQVLEVTGPVEVDGTSVAASDVEPLLLHDQYEGLSDDSADVGAGRYREEELGTLAQAAFGALQDRSVDVHSLAEAMATAAEGRHIMVWSSSPTVEASWTSLGIAGRLTPRSVAVDLVNRGGDKLDQYMSVHVTVRDDQGRPGRATLTVDIANHTPPGQSQYIAGPYPGLGTVYGQYIGILTVNLPRGVTRPSVVGDPDLDALGPEGPTELVGVPVDVAAGRTQAITLDVSVPDATLRSTVVPSARVVPVTWSTPGGHHDDDRPFTIRW